MSAAFHLSSHTSSIRHKVPEESYLENFISCRAEKSIVSTPDQTISECLYFKQRTVLIQDSNQNPVEEEFIPAKLKSLAVYYSTIICSSIALKNKLRFLEEIDEKLQQWMILTVTGSHYQQKKDSWDISPKPGRLHQGTTACFSQRTSPYLHKAGAISSACLVPQSKNTSEYW